MTATRRIVAWTSLTLDGYTSGPDGTSGDSWLYEHAGEPSTAEYFEGIWRGADTIVLGRTNYEGFYSVGPTSPATRPPTPGRATSAAGSTPPRRSLSPAPSPRRRGRLAHYERPRRRDRAAAPGAWPRRAGDQQRQRHRRALRLDLVDDLRFAIVPVLVGGGLRLFPDGVTARFQTAGVTALEHGAIGLHLRRP